MVLQAFEALTQPTAHDVAPSPAPVALPMVPPVPTASPAVDPAAATTLRYAHWFGGIGCAAHQLSASFVPHCYFDHDADANSHFTAAFPSAICSGTFEAAMAPDSAFMAAAKTYPVGFCSPPCSDISKINDYRDEFSACADLTIESVRKLCLVGHEVF
jgi:hypothetical protein